MNYNTTYDKDFKPSKNYLDNMPDIQNSAFKKNVKIERVGISNFLIPIQIRERGKGRGIQEPIASITGTVSLEAEKKGINMSRIIRQLQKHQISENPITSLEYIKKLLLAYKKEIESFEASIDVNFKYKIWQDALRTPDEGGYQFYDVGLNFSIDKEDQVKTIMTFDYIYSSACPCSTALSKYAMDTRNQYAIPHSQRSVARITIENPDEIIYIEDLLEVCKEAIPTETLVFCKRIDEQAFAELNASQPIFVEDAVRLLYEKISDSWPKSNFRVVCSHNESLHNHNAVAILTYGDMNSEVSYSELLSMIK